MASTISLDGSLFGLGQARRGPSNIDEDLEIFGSETLGRDGTLTLLQTGAKRRWTLSWDKVPRATRDAVRGLALLTRTFTYTDPDGTSYTVQCPKSGRYKSGIGILAADNTLLYYGVTLTIWEA